MIKGNLVYGQSGGPSSVINASAYGVIKEAIKNRDIIEKVFVMKHGISGIINDDLIDVVEFKDQLEFLKNTPSSAFGSVRYKLPSYLEDPLVYEKMFKTFSKYNIKYFVYNGGNDSMDTCLKLNEYIKKHNLDIQVIGVPKTVDNDLPHTDHTPGFGSAAKYIANTMMQIKLDSTVYENGKITIVEIMGRHAGWLTAASHVANLHNLGPDLVYLPEVKIDLNVLVQQVIDVYGNSSNCLIAVSEGIKDLDGNFIGMMNSFKDAFGHNQLGGVAMKLGELLQEKLGISYRAIELSSTQRSAAFIRSESDVLEAEMVGRKAVEFILNGNSGKMVTIKRISNDPYTIQYEAYDVGEIANLEKVIPGSMINGMEMTQEFFDYILPLIEGEADVVYKHGMQQLFKLKK